MRRRLIALASGPILLFGSLMTTALVAPPANAASTTLCSTVSGCKTADRSTFGWESNLWTEYWGQAPGHNCTNYVAYRLITTNGMGTSRPWSQLGDAKTWGIYNASITTSTPARGSVAWWDATGGRGSAGHVAYVEDVLVDGSIIVSEDSWDTKTDTGNVDHFAWKKITPGAGWPTNFIHFKDLGAGARASQRVDFNGDGKSDIFYIAANNDWLIRYSAKGKWDTVNTSTANPNRIHTGDFNGDGKTDIFYIAANNDWLIRYSAKGKWDTVNTSTANPNRIFTG